MNSVRNLSFSNVSTTNGSFSMLLDEDDDLQEFPVNMDTIPRHSVLSMMNATAALRDAVSYRRAVYLEDRFSYFLHSFKGSRTHFYAYISATVVHMAQALVRALLLRHILYSCP